MMHTLLVPVCNSQPETECTGDLLVMINGKLRPVRNENIFEVGKGRN